MKKIISLVLAISMIACLGIVFSACGGKTKTEFVAIDATDLYKEDYGMAVTKGNATLMAAINEVIDAWVADGTMAKYVDYYTDLAEALEDSSKTKPDAGSLKTSWDFGSATETITVFTESGYAPFEVVSGSDIIGVDIAIMSEVAVKMGKKLDIQDVGFDTIPTNVAESKGDAVGAAALSITAERAEVVDFSNVYFSSTLVVVSAKDKSYSSVADLSGLKVGVQGGTTGDLVISAAASAEGHSYE
ncbi:MAG: transporter substrate-binding domain-containing protein, partial [Clostridia bacterium]|nr:transporter substrate-binding domain-containing protein [Clostridia bacterium]